MRADKRYDTGVPGDDIAPQGAAYQESTDFAWTEQAFGMLERGELRGEVVSDRGIIRARVWGPCPRCGHGLDDRQVLTAVANLPSDSWRYAPWRTRSGTESAVPTFREVDVSCRCGSSHPGAPEETTGCGVSFRVELPVRPAKPGS
jgi:hypothetical protein